MNFEKEKRARQQTEAEDDKTLFRKGQEARQALVGTLTQLAQVGANADSMSTSAFQMSSQQTMAAKLKHSRGVGGA